MRHSDLKAIINTKRLGATEPFLLSLDMLAELAVK